MNNSFETLKSHEEEDSQSRFRKALDQRLDELITEGSLPEGMAEARKKRGYLIDQGIDDDPEAMAIQFAEVDIEDIKLFGEMIDEAERAAIEKVQPIIDYLTNLVEKTKSNEVKVSVQERLDKIQAALENLQEQVAAARNLDVGESDLLTQIEQFKEDLEEGVPSENES